jgi:hypothetical protein
LLDGRGGVRRLGPPLARGSVAPAADGAQVAYLAGGHGASLSGPTSGRLDEVWITRQDGDRGERLFVLPRSEGNEQLVDLSWAPDGRHLLAAGQQALAGGGQRTRLRWLDSGGPGGEGGGERRDALGLPSAVVPGAHVWSPICNQAALLAHAGQVTSLCLLDAERGDFRYLADLGRTAAGPPPFPPVAWSPEGRRLLYAAPADDPSAARAGLLGPLVARPSTVLYAADAEQPSVRALGEGPGPFPAWRPDGSVVALQRPSRFGPTVLRTRDPDGRLREVAALPVLPMRAGATFAVRWDLAHAQAIVAVGGSSAVGVAGRPEYWLVRFRPEAVP